MNEMADIFHLAPIAMWIEDFSAVADQFERWRQTGVTDIRRFLQEDRSRIAACTSLIRVVSVNRRTLEMFEADSLEQLTAHLSCIFRDEMVDRAVDELSALFEGATEFVGCTVNYSLSGRRMDIRLRSAVMPGHEQNLDRILLTTEDVTEREDAHRGELLQRRYAEGLFQHSPVSLWVEDFSSLKARLDGLRADGVSDIRAHMEANPDFVRDGLRQVRVIDVNRATLELFGASSIDMLMEHVTEIFRDDLERPFRERLMELWNDQFSGQREVRAYALDGSERYLVMQFSVLPGYEHDWSRVQMALTDITARKQAEARLEYLGRYDVLTGLNNRAFYIEELSRIDRQPEAPVSAVMIDLNGLKETNDQFGHDAGDTLLRRLGEVLGNTVRPPCHAARIGGDEFAILMPGADEPSASGMLETVLDQLALNNERHAGPPLSIAIGAATREQGEPIDSLLRRADAAMYHQKRIVRTTRARLPREMRSLVP